MEAGNKAGRWLIDCSWTRETDSLPSKGWYFKSWSKGLLSEREDKNKDLEPRLQPRDTPPATTTIESTLWCLWFWEGIRKQENVLVLFIAENQGHSFVV